MEIHANAKHLVEMYGEKLVGLTVDTPALGEWPGGVSKIIAVAPDPAAPEIVFNVEHEEHGRIGVFGHEMVTLNPE